MKRKKYKDTLFIMNLNNQNYIRFENDFKKLLEKYGVSFDEEQERLEYASLRLRAFQDAKNAVGIFIESETNKKEGEKVEYKQQLLWVPKRRYIHHLEGRVFDE
jgi:hypothetical protein